MSKKVYLLVLAFIVLCLLIMLYKGFFEGFSRLSSTEDVQKSLEKKEASKEKLKDTPDWYMTYYMPSCFEPVEGDSSTMGAVRIHWEKLYPDEHVVGTLFEGSTDTVVMGTFNGSHLALTDYYFFKGQQLLHPLTISADFSDDFTNFKGTYNAQLLFDFKKQVPYKGCPESGEISGTVSAEPCKNLEGTVCP